MSEQRRRFSLMPLTFSSWIKRTGKTTSSPAVPPQAPVPRPAAADRNAWHAYWQAQGQPWRTEPEIDQKRQAELAKRQAVVPDIEKGIYPFQEVKLSRADVEWLLATHDNVQGPVNSREDELSRRKGLDLRGTDLRMLDLRNLPLARVYGGLRWNEWSMATEAQRRRAGALLENTNLSGAHLERTRFRGALLKGANLRYAHLEESDLRWANLERADLTGAYLERSSIDGMKLSDENGVGPRLADIHWGDTNLAVVDWSQVRMLGDECEARQKLHGRVAKDSEKRLLQYEQAVRANRQLAVVLQAQGLNENAARFAYRAQVLQKSVFGFQILRSSVKLKQRMQALRAWLFSWFLFLIAGYGYKPDRSFFAYFLVISGFATAYYFLGHTVGPTLSPLGAFVFSMTSFHGRGFFPGNNISLDDPLTVLAAFEALVGLIIEVTFIATLTQRLFNR